MFIYLPIFVGESSMNPDLIGKFCEQIDNLIAFVDLLMLEETDTPQKLVYFENRVTLHELKKAFETAMKLYCDGQYDEKAFQETLKVIFAERWERIRHTSAAYTEPRYNATNDLCLDIAKILIKKIKNIKKQNFDENDDVFVKWVEYVEDRPFNDVRYYISNSKLKKLGWDITKKFEESIDELL